jgi:hypothetical protein
VFLNVPFDEPYEPIFIGLLGALVSLGKRPTTVLELGGGATPRMDRLIDDLRSSDLRRIDRDSHTAEGTIDRTGI